MVSCMEQLLLFENPIDVEKEIYKLKEQYDKTRKSLYAKNSELQKLINEQRQDIEYLKQCICKSNSFSLNS